jgi:UDP-glucose 4-epimerase
MMRVLVTGGAGFIGSHVAEQLQQAGHEVHVLDDLSSGKRQHLTDGMTLHEGSIGDAAFVEATFAQVQPELVFHLAAQISVVVSIEDPRRDMALNIGGSLNLIEAARRHGQPKIIYSSTGGAAYGDPAPEDLPVPETYPVRPLSPYGITKHTVEHYLEMEQQVHGQCYTVLRYSNVYGPRQDPHGEAGVVAIFTQRLLEGRSCTVFGDGEQTRDFCYVGEVARATVLAAERGDGEIINIGTGQEVTVNEVVAALEAAAGRPLDVVHAPERPGEVRRISLGVDKAEKVLGWRPEVDFRDGIVRTWESYGVAHRG